MGRSKVCLAGNNQKWLAKEEQKCGTAATFSPCTLQAHPLCDRWDIGKVLFKALGQRCRSLPYKIQEKRGEQGVVFTSVNFVPFLLAWFQSIPLRFSCRGPLIELYALLPSPTLICICQKLVCGLCSPFLTLAMCVPSFKLCFLEMLKRTQSSCSNQGQVSSSQDFYPKSHKGSIRNSNWLPVRKPLTCFLSPIIK